MRDTIDRNRFKSRVAKDDLVRGLARGVPIERGAYVGRKNPAKFRNRFEKLDGHRLALGFEVNGRFAITVIVANAILVPKRSSDLRRQLIVQRIDQTANVVFNIARVQSDFPLIARVQDILQVGQNFHDSFVAWQRTMPKMVHAIVRRVRCNNLLGQLR